MVVAALTCFIALVVAWMIAPDERRPGEPAAGAVAASLDLERVERLAA